ncbi:hypothetical protein D3C87_1680290 [compost metagenome]
MLDIVAAHQHQTAPGVHRRRIENLQARLPVATATDKRGRPAAPAQYPENNCQNKQG